MAPSSRGRSRRPPPPTSPKTPLTAGEISSAVAELVGYELAESPADGDEDGPYLFRITRSGNACIRSGHSVRSYMDTQKATGDTYYGSVVQGNMTGGVASTGDHNTINAGNGIDSQALTALVQGLRDVAPQLGLDDVDAGDFEVEVEALEREGGDAEQGARIWRRIMRLAGPALTTAVASGVGAKLVELGSGLYA